MFRNRIYYRIKPLVPTTIRLSIRRWMAQKTRHRARNTWPIMPGSEQPPPAWPGWPDRKPFAFVLTHDVEGPEGHRKARLLMEIEKDLGFRSSFNFIPEGAYGVSPEFRAEFVRNGFEIGVHDLKHNGRLYLTRHGFSRSAQRINHYLKEWNAVGFRSGFMLHNLNWLHDLKIEYDASTFDTDPFEPQPDSRKTIFPFWVSNGDGGYVELPYTLAQDSTLFLLLQEQNGALWNQKLDWVASHGGMALLNVHPDYISFDSQPAQSRTFPVERYVQFLKGVRERYHDRFWQPLPRELARFVAGVRPPPPRRKPNRRICMITHSYYEHDNRVLRYAEALAQRGDEVDVLAVRRNPEIAREEMMAGVRVFRLQKRSGKRERKKLSYLFPLIRFLVLSSLWVARRHRQKPYDLVHVHNIPDFLIFAAWVPKFTGAKLLLDIHDIVPEFYASKFGARRRSPAVKMLERVERASAGFADHVILANHLWLEKYAARSAAPGKCSVFINNVDSQIFQARPRTRTDDKLIALFPGSLQWHQGIDIAIRALEKVVARLPNVEFHIYGDGNMKDSLIALTRELNLDGKVRFFEPLRVREIAQVMANADLGVVPKRADSFGNEAYSTKIMEFMSVGVPVVVSNTKIDQFYFDDSVVRFFKSGDPDSLAEGMIEVLSNTALRESLVRNAAEYVARNEWERRKADYLSLVDSLCEVDGHRH